MNVNFIDKYISQFVNITNYVSVTFFILNQFKNVLNLTQVLWSFYDKFYNKSGKNILY